MLSFVMDLLWKPQITLPITAESEASVFVMKMFLQQDCGFVTSSLTAVLA